MTVHYIYYLLIILFTTRCPQGVPWSSPDELLQNHQLQQLYGGGSYCKHTPWAFKNLCWQAVSFHL